MLKHYLAVGEIVGTHGLKGELRLNPWCDSGKFLKKFKTLYLDEEGQRKTALLSSREHGNIVLITLEGIDSVEKAEKLRKTVLYIDREDAELPENTWFIEDLIGCTVKEKDTDTVYGVITDVMKYPANDVWTVKTKSGKEVLIPAIKDVIINVDTESKLAEIHALRGLFSEEEKVQENEN